MWVARATGMKVRRYFVGFGPTLWSTRRPNKLGYTEYGVKAIPLGGFCDIAGMTSIDEIAPEDSRYAMYKQKTWKRAAVLLAGPGMNFIVGLVILYGIALYWGLPNLNPQPAAYVSQTSCVAPQISKDKYAHCTGDGPAATAGIKQGDVIVKVGATDVHNPDEMVEAVRKANGPTPFVVQRKQGGATTEITTVIDVVPTQRFTSDTAKAPSTVGAVGVSAAEFGPVEYAHFNPVTAIPGTISFTGDLVVELGKSIAKIPTKIGALVHSIGGGERDPETPISVVGASIIGGDAFERGLFMAFWFFLAQLNFVLGAVNLVPLLPFDGGHIAVAVFEKIRNMLRKARGMAAAAPVNYLKLMPATYVILVFVIGYMALTVTADFVNPIRPFQ
jgi:membrane-associated protease RseP (regulator of RpoE activity)